MEYLRIWNPEKKGIIEGRIKYSYKNLPLILSMYEIENFTNIFSIYDTQWMQLNKVRLDLIQSYTKCTTILLFFSSIPISLPKYSLYK